MSQLAVTSLNNNQSVAVASSTNQLAVDWKKFPSEIISEIFLQLISQGGSLQDVTSVLRTNKHLNFFCSKHIPIFWKTLSQKYFSGSYKQNPGSL